MFLKLVLLKLAFSLEAREAVRTEVVAVAGALSFPDANDLAAFQEAISPPDLSGFPSAADLAEAFGNAADLLQGTKLGEQVQTLIGVLPTLTDSFKQLMNAAPVQELHSLYIIKQQIQKAHTLNTETDKALADIRAQSWSTVEALTATPKVFKQMQETCSRHWMGGKTERKGVFGGLKSLWKTWNEGRNAVSSVTNAATAAAAAAAAAAKLVPEPAAPAVDPAPEPAAPVDPAPVQPAPVEPAPELAAQDDTASEGPKADLQTSAIQVAGRKAATVRRVSGNPEAAADPAAATPAAETLADETSAEKTPPAPEPSTPVQEPKSVRPDLRVAETPAAETPADETPAAPEPSLPAEQSPAAAEPSTPAEQSEPAAPAVDPAPEPAAPVAETPTEKSPPAPEPSTPVPAPVPVRVAETPECTAHRTAVIEALSDVEAAIERYKPFWESPGESSLADFGKSAFYFFTRHSWRDICCPNNCCKCARANQNVVVNAIGEEELTDADMVKVMREENPLLVNRFGEVDSDENVWSAIERRLDVSDAAMKTYVDQCPDSMVNLFDHQADEKTRTAAKLALCVSDSDGLFAFETSGSPQDEALNTWAASVLQYQTDQMEKRFSTVVCPALAMAAASLVAEAGAEADEGTHPLAMAAASVEAGAEAELATFVVESYFNEGCGSDTDPSSVVLRCTDDTLRVGVLTAVLPTFGADKAAALKERFAAGVRSLGLDVLAKQTSCFKQPSPRIPSKVKTQVAELAKKALGHFETASVHARDVASVAAVLSGGGGVVFAPGVLGMASAVAWMAGRVDELVWGPLDLGENCVQAAFAMSGMMNPPFCTVVIENAFNARVQVLGAGASRMDMPMFVQAALDSNDAGLLPVRNCLAKESSAV